MNTSHTEEYCGDCRVLRPRIGIWCFFDNMSLCLTCANLRTQEETKNREKARQRTPPDDIQ